MPDEADKPSPIETIPSVRGGFSAIASANAPFVYFRKRSFLWVSQRDRPRLLSKLIGSLEQTPTVGLSMTELSSHTFAAISPQFEAFAPRLTGYC